MKSIHILIIVVFSIIILAGNTLNAQEVTTKKIDPKKIVFWFNVNVKIRDDKTTGQKVYEVRRVAKKVYSGKLSEYDESLWKGIKSGTQIAIGPFSDFKQANEAMSMYDLTSPRKDNPNVNYSQTDPVYWFLIKVDIMPRLKSYTLERMAARVATGTKKEFEDVLWEGLSFLTLAVGPFWTYTDAEEAKRMYRTEE